MQKMTDQGYVMDHLFVDDICYFLHVICLLFAVPAEVIRVLGGIQIQVWHCLPLQ